MHTNSLLNLLMKDPHLVPQQTNATMAWNERQMNSQVREPMTAAPVNNEGNTNVAPRVCGDVITGAAASALLSLQPCNETEEVTAAFFVFLVLTKPTHLPKVSKRAQR